MPIDTTEKKIEDLIEIHLKNHDNQTRTNDDFDKVNALDPELFFQFLEKTQPKQISKLYERGCRSF